MDASWPSRNYFARALDLLGVALGPVGTTLGPFRATSEPSWALLACFVAFLGPLRGLLGSPWGHFGPPWGHLGLSWGALWPSWATSGLAGAILGPPWFHHVVIMGSLGVLRCLLGASHSGGKCVCLPGKAVPSSLNYGMGVSKRVAFVSKSLGVSKTGVFGLAIF